MNCPNCSKEIKENQKFCTNCGYDVRHHIKFEQFKNKVIENKALIIKITIIFVVCVCIFASVLCVNYFVKLGANGSYKSVVPIEKYTAENMSTTALLDIAIQQEKDMADFLKKGNVKKSSKVFTTFYKNLEILVENMSVDDLDVTLLSNGTYKLYPETKLINYSVNDWTGIWINNEYLYNTYSEFLDDSWQNYLKLSSNDTEDKIFTNMLVNSKKLVEEIIEWQNFISKYPHFVLSDNAKANLKADVYGILYNDYAFVYSNDGTASKDFINGYNEFLKTVDKNTDEYKIVEKCFNALKKRNFKTSPEFFKAIYDYTKYDWCKDFYERAVIKDFETEEKWQNVSDGIYFDKDSINIQGDYISGNFKQYNHYGDLYNDTLYSYRTIKTAAFCDVDMQGGVRKIEFPIYKYYDINGRFIEENDIHESWSKEHSEGHLGVERADDDVNGDVYFNTLCSYYNV